MVKKDNSSLVFVGFLFLGIAFGMLFSNVAIGTLLGLGAGFLGMYYVKNRK